MPEHTPNIKTLDLSKNKIHFTLQSQFKEFLSPSRLGGLAHLTRLSLRGNKSMEAEYLWQWNINKV